MSDTTTEQEHTFNHGQLMYWGEDGNWIAVQGHVDLAEFTAAADLMATTDDPDLEPDWLPRRVTTEASDPSVAAGVVDPSEGSGHWCGVADELAARVAARTDDDGMDFTVDTIRSTAERLLAWCSDERAERQVVGSILAPLLPSVAARVRAEERAGEGHWCEVADDLAARLAATEEAADRVRAEERQRAASELQRSFKDTPGVDWGDVIEVSRRILAAGSAVPVATPTTCEHGSPREHEYAAGQRRTSTHCPGPVAIPASLEVNFADEFMPLSARVGDQEARRLGLMGTRPVATPTEPADLIAAHAEQRVTEADVRAVLAGTYTPEGIELWWYAPNGNLMGFTPRRVFDTGYELDVLEEAERVAGAM